MQNLAQIQIALNLAIFPAEGELLHRALQGMGMFGDVKVDFALKYAIL